MRTRCTRLILAILLAVTLLVTSSRGAVAQQPAPFGVPPASAGAIEPTMIRAYAWHTFYGSADKDEAHGLAVDGDGNIYIAGYSREAWLGEHGENPLHAHTDGGWDLYVLKLDHDGHYLWHTFYGDPNWYDEIWGIALDDEGGVYLTGRSGPWLGDGGTPPLHPCTGGNYGDILVMKLNSAGAYQWHTYYGAENYREVGYAIAVDAVEGAVYVTGYQSYNPWSGDGGAPPLHAFGGFEDIFILKLTTDGAYQWHTFYGDPAEQYAYGLVLDADGNPIVAGLSYNSWLGDAGENPLHPYSGTWDIVVLKLNKAGAYQWHTYYGGPAEEWAYGLARDGGGNLYLAGASKANWQGDGDAVPLHAHTSGNNYDVTVLKLGGDGAYQWHTFYGSPYRDWGRALAVDAAGDRLAVVAYTEGAWAGLPRPLRAWPATTAGLGLTGDGAYDWHGFYGGWDGEEPANVALLDAGDTYLLGNFAASWLGEFGRPPLHAYTDDMDGGLVRIGLHEASFYAQLPVMMREKGR